MRLSSALSVAATVAVLSTATAATAGPRIVNGLNSTDFPTTGALMYAGNTNINNDNADSWCSGTLIGCETFLTAAHCVEDDLTPGHYWVLLQHGGIRTVTSIASHPSYSFPEADVAVLKLSSPFTGIDPTELNLQESPPFATAGEIAGFGQTDGSAGDYGIKREGDVVTSSCSGVVGGGLGDTELVCWSFTNPVGAAGQDSNTCNGDSGGPLFLDLGNGPVVAGITSGGNNGTCLATDDSYDANVYTYRNFIQTNLGADSTAACGGIPAVGDPTADVIGIEGSLSGGNSSDSEIISVSGSPDELRFVLNGVNNGSLEVDYYVKQGLGASTTNFDCKDDGAANTGDCSFTNPAAGDWSVFINRTSGAGEYQVTATILGTDPPVCGNDINEAGEECDGTDDAACSGLCQIDCTCPAPVCGNDVIESGEECDGVDPGTCPTGACDIDCTCPDPVCGNDIVETGEQCDGADDSACPGACDGATCTCPATCNIGDLFISKGKSSEKKFQWKGEIDNNSGTYDGLDPRNGFFFTVVQGSDGAQVSTPAMDPGWVKSKPEKGRYKWKGSLNGLVAVKLTDKTAKRGIWQVLVKGKAVPGAENIDVVSFFADVELTMDGVCAGGEY